MSLFVIYYTFLKVGFFTIGGGLAALPLLQVYLVDGGWVNQKTFIDMIAISQSTPGPIGINMATYAGYQAMGFPGAIMATTGMVTPSLIIIILIARFMRDFNDHPSVKYLLSGLRPAALGMIAAAVWFVLGESIFHFDLFPRGNWLDWKGISMFIVFGALYYRWRLHPFFYIIAGAIAGIFIF